MSTLELGHARSLRWRVIEAIFGALGARFDARVLWNGPELDRMFDQAHATVASVVKRRLERWRWVVHVEVSYSRYGERGRVDLLAFHPATGSLLIVEVKTELVDVQNLLGMLDAKARLGRHVAERYGWAVRAVVPAIVFSESKTTRTRLVRVDALFDRFSLRGRRAITWLRRPSGKPSGLLWFVTIVDVPGRSERPRVRRSYQTGKG